MFLAKVIGNVVCTVKTPSLEGKKLLLIQRLSGGRASGTAPVAASVAVDAVGAGPGEIVYVCRGREATFAFLPEQVPTEATIVAIVDQVYVDKAYEVDAVGTQ